MRQRDLPPPGIRSAWDDVIHRSARGLQVEAGRSVKEVLRTQAGPGLNAKEQDTLYKKRRTSQVSGKKL